jgi:hypothetical protein
MAEYDDTNKGAAFTPFPTQRLILQGKVNVEGVDSKIVCIMDETRDGKQIIEVYQKAGVLFQNDNTKDGAPDYTGPLFDTKRIAAWKRMKDEKPYMSFNISEKQEQGSNSSLPNDDIPF